jgi:KUP system potassium uptake protein
VPGAPPQARREAEGRYLLVLSLAALGVVYGDIGTSPLYAFRESFNPKHGIAITPENVLGILSLIFWALLLVISLKYLVFVMRADNRGEGGMIALTALVAPVRERARGAGAILTLVGLFGASLLYGDSVITPAISVLSAVEGLQIATSFFDPYITPITLVILVMLFAVQSKGTGGVGKVFGPVTLVWFATLAVLGVGQIVRHPGVLRAVSPLYGVEFFVRNGWRGFLVLGSVFLVVTGGEALYADMGHFGKKPIRLTWFVLVLPALLLNYFGQGALIISDPTAVEHPFFHMAPDWALYPLVVLATAATVIASQAVISGAFSLTRQAVQLGYLPRVAIAHTSAREIGQIYIPSVNWALMLGCIALVLGFHSSTNLASAYGVAVTTDMVFTTILFATVAHKRWGWSVPRAAALAAFFLVIDLSFWGANIIKIPSGGWVPLVIAAVMLTLMTTWKRGRQILAKRMRVGLLPIDMFLDSIARTPPLRVPGTAIFMYGDPKGTPPALLHNLKHNKVLHERVVFLSVLTEEIPYIDGNSRITAESLGANIHRVVARYGFAEDADITEILQLCAPHGLEFKMMDTTFFLGRETLIATRHHKGMAVWRERLFAIMATNSQRATAFFRIPANRVVELGAQIEI